MSVIPLRRILVSIGVIAALVGTVVLLPADEGEWLPEQLADMDFTPLHARGLELDATELWDGEQGLLSAAVQINGCSASFVSEAGLIVTNHHCGFAAINAASTLERNLLEDGFVSGEFGEEIPAPGYSVSFVRRYEDVTAQMHEAADAAGEDPVERWRAVRSERRRLEQEANSPTSSAIVVPYFEGREWRRIWRTVITDVRLVYAPPRSVGEYGGETDNWMWPRHTGDFSFFRAYVAPDGTPRGYSEDNVPYNPPRHLQVAPSGVEEGDLVMILGYPGRTERYLSSVAVASRESWYYPRRQELFRAIIGAYEEAGAADPELALKVQSAIKSFSNGMKNADGMVWGLSRNKVVERKQQEELDFREWVAADRDREKRYGTVLDELLELDLRVQARARHDFVLNGLQRRSPGFGRILRSVSRQIDLPSLEEISGKLVGVDRAALKLLFQWADELPDDQRLASFDGWKDGGLDEDRLPELAMAVIDELSELRNFNDEIAGLRMDVGARWIAAQEEWRGKRFYPDANSTLRVSFASVKNYAPRDGVLHTPHTTVGGAIMKDESGGDFDMPEEILAAVAADPSKADIHVCFLADGDTTGGNSGSPVVNGKGELVGLNFDRVFENVSGDFGWDKDRSRNISVDMSYVLWLMREVWPAPRLLAEMGLE